MGIFQPKPSRVSDWVCSHIMVDTETYDTGDDAAIASIGACWFDPYQVQTYDELKQYSFYITIDRASALAYGRTVSAATMKWWSEQNQVAFDALTLDCQDFKHALIRFAAWATDWDHRPTQIWSNGPEFDIVKLQRSFQAAKVIWPSGLSFWMNQSMRTLDYFAWPNGDRPAIEGTAHNAEDDAIAQAIRCQKGHQILGLGYNHAVAAQEGFLKRAKRVAK